MTRPFWAALALTATLMLGACQSTASRVEQFGARNVMLFAMNKPYEQVVNTPDFQADTLGREKIYGPLLASYTLASGDAVHRHIKSDVSSTSNVDLGLITQRERENYTIRLAYFRVGPDGIVRDWAAGSVPGASSRCVGYAGGIIRRCDDRAAIDRSLAEFDAIVRTSAGQPLSSWGPSASPAIVPVDEGS